MDTIVPYACQSANTFSDIPGSAVPPAPQPLLPNLGKAGGLSTMADLQVSTPLIFGSGIRFDDLVLRW